MKKNNSTPLPDLSPYIDAISARFRPAQNLEEATHHFSTSEVTEAIRDLNPGLQISDSLVFEAMKKAGFRFDIAKGRQSLKYQWLLVEK